MHAALQHYCQPVLLKENVLVAGVRSCPTWPVKVIYRLVDYEGKPLTLFLSCAACDATALRIRRTEAIGDKLRCVRR